MRRQRLPGAVKVSCHEGSACIANYLQSVGSQNHTHKASCHEGSACITHYELQSVGSQNHTHTHTHTHTTESFLEQLLGAVKVSCHEGSACIANYLQSVGSQNHTHTHTQLRSFPGVYTTCTRRTACPSNLKNTEWKPYTYKCKPGNPLNNAFASCNLICSSQPSVQALHLHRSFISICVPLKQQQRRASTRVW